MQYSLLTEFLFQKALPGINFCTSLGFNICCCSGVTFFTNLTNLNFRSFASDSLKSFLSWRFWSNFWICWLNICRPLFWLGASLITGFYIKGSEAAVTLFLILSSIELLVTSCSTYSLTLSISLWSCSLHNLQLWILLHLKDISFSAFSTFSKSLWDLIDKLSLKASVFHHCVYRFHWIQCNLSQYSYVTDLYLDLCEKHF